MTVLDGAGDALHPDLAAELLTCIGSFSAAQGDDEDAARRFEAARQLRQA